MSHKLHGPQRIQPLGTRPVGFPGGETVADATRLPCPHFPDHAIKVWRTSHFSAQHGMPGIH